MGIFYLILFYICVANLIRAALNTVFKNWGIIINKIDKNVKKPQFIYKFVNEPSRINQYVYITQYYELMNDSQYCNIFIKILYFSFSIIPIYIKENVYVYNKHYYISLEDEYKLFNFTDTLENIYNKYYNKVEELKIEKKKYMDNMDKINKDFIDLTK